MKKLLRFDQFDPIYEADGSESSQEEVQMVRVVSKKTGEPNDDINSVVDMLMSIDKSGKKVEESNVYEQEVKTPFKPVIMGEKSDRVKIIQKYLGLKEDGIFGGLTKKAVEKFQTENKLKIDGKVGEQTYSKMLEIKLNIKDKSEISKKVDDFRNMTEQAKVIVDSIIKDPRFYDCFESITIIIVDGQTRVVCIPKKDANEKIAGIKKDGLLTADFVWLEKVGEAVGKAIVFTVAAPIIISIEVAKAMISGIVSIGKFVAKSAASIVSNIVYGATQIAKWSKQKGAQIYASVKAEGQALWKKFCENASNVVKISKEALLAFTGAINTALGKANEALKNVAFIALGTAAKAVGLAWEGMKTLDGAVKDGFKTLASKGADAAKKFKEGVAAGYSETKDVVIKTGQDVVSRAKTLGKSALKTIGSGIQYVGDQITSFGSWIGELAESLFLETGDPIFEELIF